MCTIYKHSKISIYRLDFDEFLLQPPYWGECKYDRFYAESATPLPVLCGVNNGSHSKYTVGSYMCDILVIAWLYLTLCKYTLTIVQIFRSTILVLSSSLTVNILGLSLTEILNLKLHNYFLSC